MDKKDIVINQLAMRAAQLEADKAFLIAEIEAIKGESEHERSKCADKSRPAKTQ